MSLTVKKKLKYVEEYIKWIQDKIKSGRASTYDHARLEAFNWLLYEYHRLSGIIESAEEPAVIGEYEND